MLSQLWALGVFGNAGRDFRHPGYNPYVGSSGSLYSVAISPSIIRRIFGNPVVVLPLGAGLVVVLLSVVSGFGADPLVVNERFLIFLVCIPFVVGICMRMGQRFWNSAGHGLLAWLGSTVLAAILSLVVFAYVAPADPAAYSNYNYSHFDRDAYVTANPLRRVVAGGAALPYTV